MFRSFWYLRLRWIHWKGFNWILYNGFKEFSWILYKGFRWTLWIWFNASHQNDLNMFLRTRVCDDYLFLKFVSQTIAVIASIENDSRWILCSWIQKLWTLSNELNSNKWQSEIGMYNSEKKKCGFGRSECFKLKNPKLCVVWGLGCLEFYWECLSCLWLGGDLLCTCVF